MHSNLKPKRLYLAQGAQPLSLCRSILFRVQQVFKRIRRVALCLFYRMDVAVGGFELGVTESCGDVFDVGAVAQEQRRRGVAQGVELLVRKVMALEEYAEPERRCGRVHRLAVRLNEYPVVAVPGVAQSELQPGLLRAAAFEHGNAVCGQHDRNRSTTTPSPKTQALGKHRGLDYT